MPPGEYTSAYVDGPQRFAAASGHLKKQVLKQVFVRGAVSTR